ncbi:MULTISPECIES: peptide chain release factor N(5)-glutamine methyltransferase [Yersinia pseudotuberculosis complex]|uniref:Release factor glutamine methyltransferase n=1 Tax=Yersinia pseudotuberculosis serotype O:1b (strain IP 31758) TaxID=349747 RepID=A0A0U1QWS6_YERP3|nr:MULTISPECIES: peptide chain release factor N(5)-glutamine methyltransferase [Yersinia pseudotuberculosis complex]ABS47058.1 methyltransferase, HemK family [Yersinia pseudotuberculosis IP 31758]MCE4111003.1 peptide chain release factor N(5)-glutamine methyltransferase [Yersinia pseudotuberculosis]MCF1161865.1 peptide chain release factor N(5)-glutamine methyltransferase [Yersinia pseudotuberculosis]RYC26536.1 peptide chain release factor N(5)-glutamine methyltransferase [Yersinia pseudotuberc
MNYQHWLSLAAARFTHSDSPKRDAEILLSFVTGKARTYLLAFGETEITAEQLLWLETLANRREQGEPIAYLVGEREFWSLPLSVSSATLIPRPDTECLVEQALARLPSMPCRILDLGTGTGAIALALASERRDCAVIAVDINADAVALARHNAKKLAIDNVCFLQGSWFEPVSGRFALIASNPPYIDANDPHLNEGDVRYEPHSVLVAAAEGMADLAAIVSQAPGYLEPGGWLMLEHGWQQANAVQERLKNSGFSAVMTCKDYGNNDRVTLGQWSV